MSKQNPFIRFLKTLEDSSFATSNRKLTPYLRYALILAPLLFTVFEIATDSGLSLWLKNHSGFVGENFLALFLMEWLLLLVVFSLPLIAFLARIPALQTEKDSRLAEKKFAAWLWQQQLVIFVVSVLIFFGGTGSYFALRGLTAGELMTVTPTQLANALQAHQLSSKYVDVTGFVRRSEAIDVASRIDASLVYTYAPLHENPDANDASPIFVETFYDWFDSGANAYTILSDSNDIMEVRAKGIISSLPKKIQMQSTQNDADLSHAVAIDTTNDPVGYKNMGFAILFWGAIIISLIFAIKIWRSRNIQKR